MAMRSANGSPKGPWNGPELIYAPSAPGAKHEWYSSIGIDNPAILMLKDGTSYLMGRTCSGPEHPWLARAGRWNGSYASYPTDAQPFPMNNAEDPFLYQDKRGNFHAVHHWQNGNHNRYFNGGHSFSRDGSKWTFSNTPAYSKNISFTDGTSTLFGRRERPGILFADANWSVPLFLFSSVVDHTGASWLQSQPIRQQADPTSASGGAACSSDEDCNLNGLCRLRRCHCDPQWDGSDCGTLALEPAEHTGGFRREGYNQWGGNPFYSADTGKYHVFAVEMTYGCKIGDYITNSQIVHAEASKPGGPYSLAPIAGFDGSEPHVSAREREAYAAATTAAGPAPSSAVLVPPFAHAPHAGRDPTSGALVVVFEGRQRTEPAKQRRCG